MKYLILLFCLFFAFPAYATDVTTTAALGNATASDSIITVDDSAVAGAKMRRTLFNADTDTFLSGLGTWVDLTAIYAPVLTSDQNYVSDLELVVVQATSGANTGDQTTVSGNAGTATALAANGANCTAGSYPLGVDASGAVEDCTVAVGSGNVTKVGIPVDEQVGIWTGDGTIKGIAGFTHDGTNLTVSTGAVIAAGFTSSAADGAHYLDVVNGVSITAAVTEGFMAYYNGRMRLADGADYDNYFLEFTDIDVGVQAWDTDLDGWALISPATGSINTTGIITGAIETATDADAHTLTEAEYHGGSVLATGAGIYTLPTASAGLHGCVETGQGVAAIIQLLPATGDYIVAAGARLTIATSIKATAAAGNRVCYRAYNADDWYVSTFGTWAE